MERFNISVPKKYTTNGEEKTAWSNVGKLVKFPPKDGKGESYILELAMFPDTKFGVFEDKPKSDSAVLPSYSAENIDPQDIPF